MGNITPQITSDWHPWFSVAPGLFCKSRLHGFLGRNVVYFRFSPKGSSTRLPRFKLLTRNLLPSVEISSPPPPLFFFSRRIFRGEPPVSPRTRRFLIWRFSTAPFPNLRDLALFRFPWLISAKVLRRLTVLHTSSPFRTPTQRHVFEHGVWAG